MKIGTSTLIIQQFTSTRNVISRSFTLKMLGECGKMKVVHKTKDTWIVEVNSVQVMVLSDMNKPMMRVNLFNLKSVKDTANRQDKKKYWDVLTPDVVGGGDMIHFLRQPLRMALKFLLLNTTYGATL
jgi:hypothetical protein